MFGCGNGLNVKGIPQSMTLESVIRIPLHNDRDGFPCIGMFGNPITGGRIRCAKCRVEASPLKDRAHETPIELAGSGWR